MVTQLSAEPRWVVRCALVVSIAVGTLMAPMLGSTAAQDAGTTQPAHAADAKIFEAQQLLSFVLDRLKSRFAYPELLDQPDFVKKADALRETIAAAKSLAEAAPQINALLGELKISHTALYTPDAIEYPILLDAIGSGDGIAGLIERKYWGNLPSLESPGFFMVRIDGKWFVDGILEASPASGTNLQIGDEIVDVDGAPVDPVMSFRGKAGRTATLHVRKAKGGDVTAIDVPVKAMVPSIAFATATRQSVRVIMRNGKRIGYVHVWSSKSDEAFYAALARLTPNGTISVGQMRNSRVATPDASFDVVATEPLDGLIVDMRGKVGGSNFGRQFVEALGLGASGQIGGNIEFLGRDANPRRDRPGANAPPNPPFKGRSVMLIDHHARSALEIEAYSFQHEKMGPLIGTPTAGAVSAAQVMRAPYDTLLYVAVSRIKADGKILEGIGVHPDLRVERPLPYSNGADPVLEAAISHFDQPQ